MLKKVLRIIFLLSAVSCSFKNNVSANQPDEAAINSFQECAKAGNPVRKSLPAQCVTKDGRLFIDDKQLNVPVPAEPAADGKFCKNLCGDGTCQEIVCMALGCPCPESAESCPADCK